MLGWHALGADHCWWLVAGRRLLVAGRQLLAVSWKQLREGFPILTYDSAMNTRTVHIHYSMPTFQKVVRRWEDMQGSKQQVKMHPLHKIYFG